MERPERPSRHNIYQSIKYPIRPSFSSDSESDLNDDMPAPTRTYGTTGLIQVTAGPPDPNLNTCQSDPVTNETIDLNDSHEETEPPVSTRPAGVTEQESRGITTINCQVVTSAGFLNNSSQYVNGALGDEMPQLNRYGKRTRHAIREMKLKIAARGLRGVISNRVLESNDDMVTHYDPSDLIDFVDAGPSTSTHNSQTDSGVNPVITQADDSHDRPQRNDYVIRPRSFCHINNSSPTVKFKRLEGPIDLTPSTSCREFGSIFGSNTRTSEPSITDTQNFLFKSLPPAPHYNSSSILRRFDALCPSGTRLINCLNRPVRRPDNVTRTTEGSVSENTSTLLIAPRNDSVQINRDCASYRDLMESLIGLNCPSDSNNSQSSPERAEARPSSTTDVISRHISPSPDLIMRDTADTDISSLFDPPQETINPEQRGESMDQGNDDVIVVEPPDPLTSMHPSRAKQRRVIGGDANTSSYIVPSSRSPSPNVPLPTIPTPPTSKEPTSETKDVPVTLQELNQSLVSLLECPVCLDHATPPIYQCCKGHILCQSCHPRLTTCPICRSRLPGDRNSVMEKVAEKLMYPCKNTVTGCSQMLKLDEKQNHEEGCGFRHYACIVTNCHWKGYKPELVVHLQSNHPDRLISGAFKVLLVPVPGTAADGTSTQITFQWVQSAHNEVFHVVFHVDLLKRIMKGCVIYIGSPDKAEKFSYVFELKQRVTPYRKLSFSRTTHADPFMPGQPLCLSNDFSINIDMARLYHDYSSHAIPVHISIVHQDE